MSELWLRPSCPLDTIPDEAETECLPYILCSPLVQQCESELFLRPLSFLLHIGKHRGFCGWGQVHRLLRVLRWRDNHIPPERDLLQDFCEMNSVSSCYSLSVSIEQKNSAWPTNRAEFSFRGGSAVFQERLSVTSSSMLSDSTGASGLRILSVTWSRSGNSSSSLCPQA